MSTAFDGIPSWELNPAPAEDPNPTPADGWAMHAIAAHAVQDGDLLPLETWNRVTYVHDDREGAVQIEFTYPDGHTGTLQIVAAAKLAVLRRRSPDGFCAHHGEDWMDTDSEPWCHGCEEMRGDSDPERPTATYPTLAASSNADAAGWAEPRTGSPAWGA